jgi:cell filamentation protein
LFQDVYSWAGEKRKVEISKAGKQFFPTTHFDNAFRFMDTLSLAEHRMKNNHDLIVASANAVLLFSLLRAYN